MRHSCYNFSFVFCMRYACERGGGRVVRWGWVNFQCRGVLQFGPGRVAQSVSQGSWVRYPVWQHTFVSPSAFSRRAVVSYWRKYVHEVLVNRLGGLSLPRKSVVRLTDRPDMTLDVYRGRKTTMNNNKILQFGLQ